MNTLVSAIAYVLRLVITVVREEAVIFRAIGHFIAANPLLTLIVGCLLLALGVSGIVHSRRSGSGS